MKTEYRKSTGEPHRGAREWSANLQQDRCCEVERRADAIDEGREGARGMEAESENLPMDRVLLSSVSKKDMFRFRRTAARQFQRDVSAKNLIDPVFLSAVRLPHHIPRCGQPALRSSEAGCTWACIAGCSYAVPNLFETKGRNQWNTPERRKCSTIRAANCGC